jgi:hypothetical protein
VVADEDPLDEQALTSAAVSPKATAPMAVTLRLRHLLGQFLGLKLIHLFL